MVRHEPNSWTGSRASIRRWGGEVESLLAAHRGGSSICQGREEDTTAIRSAGPATARLERIGPYRILREIGHGGMGIVYEAEQERPVHRKVALKLIKWGMDTREVVARFESERQALALMSHPNIAAVHDAGATNEGRPYFVMEYIAGIPITEYCDTHRLGVAERLALFVRVCEGAQHAHQKGVIHRDLKPSNVLVTVQDGEPVPKIIDFGVAKATTQRLTEKTVYTELGRLIGTPEYMSPEQAEMTGLDVDTRTDVYSLGVLLYELLVGAQPFDPEELRKAGFDEIRRRIREDDPPTPSTRLSTLGDASGEIAERRHTDRVSLRRALRGDLDWIVLKALAQDRTRRYASASELPQDIWRHLRHEPVLAGPPGTAYRLGKFIRRHRVGVHRRHPGAPRSDPGHRRNDGGPSSRERSGAAGEGRSRKGAGHQRVSARRPGRGESLHGVGSRHDHSRGPGSCGRRDRDLVHRSTRDRGSGPIDHRAHVHTTEALRRGGAASQARARDPQEPSMERGTWRPSRA